MPYENNLGDGMRLALLKNVPFGFAIILVTVILKTDTVCFNIGTCTFPIHTCTCKFFLISVSTV